MTIFLSPTKAVRGLVVIGVLTKPRSASGGKGGETMDNCNGCQWWSEMIAAAFSGNPVTATCLNEDSPRFGKMAYRGCELKVDGGVAEREK